MSAEKGSFQLSVSTARILAVFVRRPLQETYAQEIATMTGVDSARVYRVTGRLLERGILLARPQTVDDGFTTGTSRTLLRLNPQRKDAARAFIRATELFEEVKIL